VQFAQQEALSKKVNDALKAAMGSGNPAGEAAQHLCELHRQWLSGYWDSYSPAAHRGLARMYVDDNRFRAYYDSVAPGAAEFLRDALLCFLPHE
jgi:hypothetical protein